MLRITTIFAFRFCVLSVLILIVARSEWRARRRQRRRARLFSRDDSNLDRVLWQGEFGFDTRAGRRVR